MTAVPVLGLEEFNKEITVFAESTVPEEVRRLAARIGLEALSSIVFKTPVDTGRARANWQTTVGSAAEGVLEKFDRSGRETVEKGSAIIESAPPFSIVWISNNVEYILVLEEGGYEPENPENSPAANKKRAQGRSKAKRAAVENQYGDEGAPLVEDGFAIQAPQGMVAVTVEELRVIFG